MSSITSLSNANFYGVYTTPTDSATSTSTTSSSADSVDSSSAYLLSENLSNLINSSSTSATSSSSSSSNSLIDNATTMDYDNSLTPAEFQYMQNINNSTDNIAALISGDTNLGSTVDVTA